MKLTRVQRDQIVANVRARGAVGDCSHAHICAIAAAAEVTPNYVYTLARNGVPDVQRAGWQLTDRAIELYYCERGVVSAVHAAIEADGGCEVGVRQLQRAFRQQLGSDERAFVRWGAARRRASSGTVLWEAPERNAVWQTDHVQLGVPVLLPGHTKTRKLWMTYFIDCYSRMVMGWMVSVRQSSDAVLEALRDAIAIDPDVSHQYGGKPLMVMYDNGLTFLAEVVQDAAAFLDFQTFAVAPYSPHQNGKVERCHQTISRLALSAIAAWDHGPRNEAGKLYDYTPISERELIERVGAAVEIYNFSRRHSALGGRTPWEAFDGDATQLRIEPPERLRFALRHRKIQKVHNKGVYKHGGWYRHVALDDREDDDVIVAWLRKDHRTVDVYDLKGEFLCTAHPQGSLSREQIIEVKRRERERYTRQKRRLNTAISEALEGYAPTNDPAGLQVINARARPRRRASASDRAEEALLNDLGLTGRVGLPWPSAQTDDDA